MSLKYVVVLLALLISAMSMAGCTGSPPQPVTNPAPLPVATPVPAPPVPAGTAAYSVTYAAPVIPVPYPPSSQTLSFNGAADYDQLTFTTESDAIWSCDLTYPASGVFTVILRNDRGETIDVLADEAGSGTVRKSVPLKAGNYYFDIKAESPWYIMMTTG